ncbi:hypothetical protein RKD25_007966 [Streptomyces sp. SAI-124]
MTARPRRHGQRAPTAPCGPSGSASTSPAAGTANGTKIEIWDCNGGTNQQWQTYNGGYRNPVSGRCLDDPNASTTDGTQLVLWDCNGGAHQQWTALPVS